MRLEHAGKIQSASLISATESEAKEPIANTTSEIAATETEAPDILSQAS